MQEIASDRTKRDRRRRLSEHPLGQAGISQDKRDEKKLLLNIEVDTAKDISPGKCGSSSWEGRRRSDKLIMRTMSNTGGTGPYAVSSLCDLVLICSLTLGIHKVLLWAFVKESAHTPSPKETFCLLHTTTGKHLTWGRDTNSAILGDSKREHRSR